MKCKDKLVRVQMSINDLVEMINNTPNLTEKLKKRYESKIKRLEEKKRKLIVKREILDAKERTRETLKQLERFYKFNVETTKDSLKTEINKIKGDAKKEKRRLERKAAYELRKEALITFCNNTVSLVSNAFSKVVTKVSNAFNGLRTLILG